MLPRLVFLLENLAKTLQKKRFEYDQIKNLIFGLNRCGRKATEKRKARNHKLPLSRHFLKIQDISSCEVLTQIFPSFQPIFNFRQEC